MTLNQVLLKLQGLRMLSFKELAISMPNSMGILMLNQRVSRWSLKQISDSIATADFKVSPIMLGTAYNKHTHPTPAGESSPPSQ